MNVILTREAEDDLGKLSRDVAARAVAKLYWLAEHFDELTPEPLGAKLRGFYKLRVGDWRVIYEIQRPTLFVHAIDHRSAIYKRF